MKQTTLDWRSPQELPPETDDVMVIHGDREDLSIDRAYRVFALWYLGNGDIIGGYAGLDAQILAWAPIPDLRGALA